jgi:hypothetical protein
MRRLALAAASLGLALPLLLAGPAYADNTPAPIASEPPGGATCAPGQPANGCGQEGGVTPAPTASPSPTRTSTPTSTSRPTGTSLPRTGSSLPRTGQQDASRTGLAGAAVLGVGVLLVLAGRRPHED